MKFTGKLFTGFGVIAACAALTITACNKSASSTDESEKVSIYLTDDAGL